MAISTATNDTAFSRNTGPGPTQATSTPPSAGPTANDAVMVTEFNEIAAGNCRAGTRSGVIAAYAGSPSVKPAPSSTVSPSNAQGVTVPVTVITPITAATSN